MSPEDLEILKHMMNGATPPEFAVRLLEDICERTNLSWKARHVYLQKRRNKTGGDTWTTVLSIDGFRTAGSRQPQYAGQAGPEWAIQPPPDHVWYDNPPEGVPYSSRVGIKKKLDNGEVTTTWGVAKYKDYYAGMMWDKFPSTMIAKCAEMLAWRKTFPETFGGLYGDAELQQVERDRGPKEALKEVEIIGEAAPPPPPPGLKNEYIQRLADAKGLEAVQKIGKEIQGNKMLLMDETLELHQVYTKARKREGG